MKDFVNYQTFSNLDEATGLIDLLNTNNIPFEVDDSSLRYDVSNANSNPMEQGLIIKISANDAEKVDKLNLKVELESSDDHFLYTFSDNDIVDVIVNPENWTEEEAAIANKILKQRNIKPTAELIKSLRKDKIIENKNEQTKQKNIVKGGVSWFLWIGILSVVNTLLLLTYQNLHFPVGLGISDAILGAAIGVKQAAGVDLMIVGYVLTFLVSGFFFWIWYKSKNNNRKFYLTGLIVYVIDTVLCAVVFVISKSWIDLAFHLFVLARLYAGFKALTAETSKSLRS